MTVNAITRRKLVMTRDYVVRPLGVEPRTSGLRVPHNQSGQCCPVRKTRLSSRTTARPTCDALGLAMRRYGVPAEVLTDNGKVFTGRFGPGTGEVLFDRICRENGIKHRLTLTRPRSPTTTGKVERWHKTLRAEFFVTAQLVG